MLPLQPLLATLDDPRSVYVLLGSESLLVRRAEAEVRARLATGPMAALNHATFVAGEDGVLAFADTARTVPMMAPRRLVEVRQAQDANVALLDALLAYVQAPSPSAVLVISGERMPGASGGVDRGVRILNAAKKVGVVLKLDGEGVDPVAFALDRARELGVAMDRPAAQALVELGGGDLAVLAADVEKCAGFVGDGGRVTEDIAREVCASTAEADVWALTDALVGRDRDRALETLHRLLEDGEPAHRLLASVAWQLRHVLAVQDAAARGIPDREANVRMPPSKLRTVRAMVAKRAMSPSALLEELATANRAMNSSRAGERRVFESFVLRLTGL